jgi:CheY-like chemotaxis protein
MSINGNGSPEEANMCGLKVLLVEDEAIIAFDLAGILQDLGCTVMPVAPSVTEALALLRAERPDLALLDLSLSDGWVMPVADALATAGVPFAVVTGHAKQRIQEPALRDALYMGKPYTHTEVLQVISRLQATMPSLPPREQGAGPAVHLEATTA